MIACYWYKQYYQPFHDFVKKKIGCAYFSSNASFKKRIKGEIINKNNANFFKSLLAKIFGHILANY